MNILIIDSKANSKQTTIMYGGRQLGDYEVTFLKNEKDIKVPLSVYDYIIFGNKEDVDKLKIVPRWVGIVNDPREFHKKLIKHRVSVEKYIVENVEFVTGWMVGKPSTVVSNIIK
jgi:hypothetical protein